MKIDLLTEPVDDYQKVVNKAITRGMLEEHIFKYKLIAYDAYELVVRLRDRFDWKEWKTGLEKERKGEFSGDFWARTYGAILMPEVMFRVSMVADHFHVPWGVAYHRLIESGEIKVIQGIAILVRERDA